MSQQYIERCREQGVPFDADIKIGAYLAANDEYFADAFRVFFELGLRIGQAMSRRIFDSHLEDADSALNDRGVELLQEERWSIANALFEFALSIPDKLISSDSYRKIFLINKAIVLRGSGQRKEMIKLLNTMDWSATHPKFSLAVHVLNDRYDEAAEIMQRIPKEDVSEHSYRAWPLFRDFRATPQFANAFEKVFGSSFDPSLRPDDLVLTAADDTPTDGQGPAIEAPEIEDDEVIATPDMDSVDEHLDEQHER